MGKLWPIALVVFSNIIYHVCAKSVPGDMDTMASLTVTYLIGAICSAAMFFLMNRHASLLHEYTKINFASILLGISIVGLEAGFILAYRNGWSVSMASIVRSAFLALALVVVGAVLYHEHITVNKVLGICICLIGLYVMNR